MDSKLLNSISITLLKQISTEGGDVLKILMSNEDSYKGFGETYISKINPYSIKAWKKHNKMTLNLIVPFGNVRFVFIDDSTGEIKTRIEEIGETNYARITVPPGIWFGFQGIYSQSSLVLNVADILHNPNEADRKPLEAFNVNWIID